MANNYISDTDTTRIAAAAARIRASAEASRSSSTPSQSTQQSNPQPSLSRTYQTQDIGESSYTDQSTSLARKTDGTYAYIANSLLGGGSSYSNPNEGGMTYTRVTDPSSVDSSQVNPNTVLHDWRGRGGGSSSSSSSSSSSYGDYDILDEIERAKKARIASRNAALSGVLDKTKASLAAERETIAPQYQTLKNNESSTSQLRAKRIAEIMAQRGYSEGYQGQSEVANNVAYRGNLGNLNTQEQGAYNDITKRGTDAQTEYESGLVQAEADEDTTASEQRLAELSTERGYAREDEQSNLENQTAAEQTAYNREQDTLDRTEAQTQQQREEFVATIGQYYNDYTQAINDIAADNDTSNDWQLPYLKAARTEKQQAQAAQQATAIAKQQADQNAATKLAYEQALERWKTAGTVKSQADARILGVSVGTKTEQYAQDQMAHSIAQQNANTSAVRARASASKEQDSTFTVSQISSKAEQMMNVKNPDGTYTYTIGDVEAYLDGILPKTSTGSKQFDDIMDLLDRLYPDRKSKYSNPIGPGLN